MPVIIRRMTATFGKLDRQSLELAPGLNLIYAPNEAGKSTWSAFLRTMLYGLTTRDRGPLADKNRYAPWSGAPMEGSMDLTEGDTHITITRHTARRGSPMGEFSACYTGTASAVPGLDGADCGESLLGVPREVYERSAFIGQSRMAIDQVGSLEQRIAALITSGQEDTSFTEAYGLLKKQLNARRHNRTGQLPALEQALEDVAERLHQVRDLGREAADIEAELPELEAHLSRCAQAVEARQRRAQLEGLRAYQDILQQLEAAQAELRLRETEAAGLPSKTELITLKSAAGAVVVNQMSLRRIRDQLENRHREAQEAARPLADFPIFNSMNAEAADEKARQDADRWSSLRKRGRSGRTLLILGFAAALPAIALLALALLPVWPGALTLLPAAVLILFGLARLPGKKAADGLAGSYGVPSGPDFLQKARSYAAHYQNWAEKARLEQETRTRLEGLSASVESSQKQILAAVQNFSSEIIDLNLAAAAIDRAVARLDRLEKAALLCDRLRIRQDALEDALGEAASAEDPGLSPAVPDQDPQLLEEQRQEAQSRLEDARRRLALIQGQMAAVGTAAELEAREAELETQRQQLEAEYAAIDLAMAQLDSANTELQTRFSPALGAEAARIFARLTGGRYHRILLDRDLSAQAETAGDPIPRSASLLSQGTMDQLYLAVRLAICRMVLPADKAAPLVLDDALASFDDQRMAQAMEVLLEESQHRQILLFTCQNRELQWAQGRDKVRQVRLSSL